MNEKRFIAIEKYKSQIAELLHEEGEIGEAE
jgi:hypothetical protein